MHRIALGTVLTLSILCGCSREAAAPENSAEAQAAAPPGAVEDMSEWPLLGRTPDMQHNSPLAQINDDTVSKLGLAWYADIPSRDGLVGNPLVVGGVVYQSGPSGRAYANDVRTGKELWRFAPAVDFDPNSIIATWSMRYSRGLAVSGDHVYVASGDCRLFAVDRRTGKQVWETVSCDRSQIIGITGAPRVGGGKVFIGNNCGDSGATRGFVDAFDERTGQRKWRFYTVPGKPGEPYENAAMEMAAKTWGTNWYEKSHGCGSAWDAMTYDAKLNLLYIGTDGPSPWSPAARAADAGDELFTNSIIAVNADTGEYVWHYKTTPNDGWNFGATMHIMVAELPIDGSTRRVVMTAPKNGFFYVLDAGTGKFISANNFTPVNWASHIDQSTGRPVTLPDARYWDNKERRGVVSPGPLGAHSWHAMAYNATTGLVYLPVVVAPTLMQVDPKSPVGGMLFDMYYGLGNDPKWQAYGELVAWDPVRQESRWRVKRKLSMNGGTLTTSGNLVFQGTADGRFDAHAADTGKQLWSYDVGGSVQAAPTTVEIDGEQVILVAAGNAGAANVGTYLARVTSTPQTRTQARLLAFKLNGGATLPKADLVPIAQPPRPRPSAAVAERGGALYERSYCVDCHGLGAESAGGVIPDLRRAGAGTHDQFNQIVIGGLLKASGMPMFSHLSADEAQAIQAYILEQAWRAYEAQQKQLQTSR